MLYLRISFFLFCLQSFVACKFKGEIDLTNDDHHHRKNLPIKNQEKPYMDFTLPSKIYYGDNILIAVETYNVNGCKLGHENLDNEENITLEMKDVKYDMELKLTCDSLPNKEIIKKIKVETTPLVSSPLNYGSVAPNDILFVLDNSQSMLKIYDHLKATLQKTVKEKSDIFPDGTRVAVMNTMIAPVANLPKETNPDPNDKSPSYYMQNQEDFDTGESKIKKNDLINIYPSISKEPGFLSLVDGESYDNYIADLKKNIALFTKESRNIANSKTRKMAEQQLEMMKEILNSRWKQRPCVNAWINPNTEASCLLNAMQASFAPVKVEAGITALTQFLQTKTNEPSFFRSGAVVNIIFISDTNDPGESELAALLEQGLYKVSTFAQIVAQIKAINPEVLGVLINGIVPTQGSCKNAQNKDIEKINSQTYLNLIKESSGIALNICNTDDYFIEMKRMLSMTQITDLTLTTNLEIKQITKIKVNNKILAQDKDYEIKNNSIKIKGVDKNSSSLILVEGECYSKKADEKCSFIEM